MTDKQRQHLLAYLGYYTASVDGDWGSESRAACTAFQQDRNLKKDGWGGPETDAALRDAVARDWTITEGETFWDGIRYWTREEFRCRCGGKYCNGFPAEPDRVLVELLEDVRTYFGRPGHRSSGLRCSTWNEIQKGAANSRHKIGKAMDFRIEGYTAVQVLEYLQGHGSTRYAYDIDGMYVHVDVR